MYLLLQKRTLPKGRVLMTIESPQDVTHELNLEAIRATLPEPFRSYRPGMPMSASAVKEMRRIINESGGTYFKTLEGAKRMNNSQLLQNRQVAIESSKYDPWETMMALDAIEATRNIHFR